MTTPVKDRPHGGIGDMQIASSGLQFGVAEQDLDGAQIDTRVQQVRRKGMA